MMLLVVFEELKVVDENIVDAFILFARIVRIGVVLNAILLCGYGWWPILCTVVPCLLFVWCMLCLLLFGIALAIFECFLASIV